MLRYIIMPRAPAAVLPGYMIAAGAFGFVGSAMISLGHSAIKIHPDNNFLQGQGVDPNIIGAVFLGIGVWIALMCTGMFGYIAIVYLSWGLARGVRMIVRRKMDSYQMVRARVVSRTALTAVQSLWSWTFPLSGMTLAWGKLAEYIPSKGFGVLNVMATIFVLLLWVINVRGCMLCRSELIVSGHRHTYAALGRQPTWRASRI